MRVDILGVPIDCVDMTQSVKIAKDHILSGEGAKSILAVNPEKVIAAGKNPVLKSALDSALLCIPDGIGVVIAAKLKGDKKISRVPGSELMPELCAMAAKEGFGIYLYGAAENVNEKASLAMQRDYPGLIVSGRSSGYVPEEKMGELVENINMSGAKMLFVALGSPRQEEWMLRYSHKLSSIKVCQGVGGTFDVLAGNVRRAPAWCCRLHVEWLYRLLSQPSRAGRQKNLPVYAYRVLAAYLRGAL